MKVQVHEAQGKTKMLKGSCSMLNVQCAPCSCHIASHHSSRLIILIIMDESSFSISSARLIHMAELLDNSIPVLIYSKYNQNLFSQTYLEYLVGNIVSFRRICTLSSTFTVAFQTQKCMAFLIKYFRNKQKLDKKQNDGFRPAATSGRN